MPGVRVTPRLDTSMTKSLEVGPLYSSSPVLVRFSSSFCTNLELSVEMAELLAMASHDPSTQASKFSFVIRLVAKAKADVTASGSPWIDKRRQNLLFELNCGCWNYLQVLPTTMADNNDECTKLFPFHSVSFELQRSVGR